MIEGIAQTAGLLIGEMSGFEHRVVLAKIGKAVFQTVTLGFRNMLDVLRGIINVFAGIFTGDWRRVWTGVKQIFEGIAQRVGSIVKT